MAIAQYSPATTLLLWLGSVNLMLGVFNLIPGFPLDGGRVLRSILWEAMGNLRRATYWASVVGQGIAWIMIVSGVALAFGARIPFFGTGLASGLWLAFIGWFLNSASAQSYQQVVVHDILEGVPVERIMRRDPPTVSPASPVSSLVHDHIMGTDDYGFPVMDGARLVGIVTLEDVRGVKPDEWDTTSVQAIMTPLARLITAAPDEDASKALEQLAKSDVRQLPVMRGGEMVGLMRRRDVLRWLYLHAQSAKTRAIAS
jgi:CBS domain-containing protein